MINKTIKTIGLCLTLFFSALFINAGDVKAETVIDSKNGGEGKGYAQCAYTWEKRGIVTGDLDSTTNDFYTPVKKYRLIVKVWGTNAFGSGSKLSWNYNFIFNKLKDYENGTKKFGDDHDADNEYTGGNGIFDYLYNPLVGSNVGTDNFKLTKFRCPKTVCYVTSVDLNSNNSGTTKWKFTSNGVKNGDCGAGMNGASLINEYDWTSVSDDITTNGDINVAPLSGKVAEENPGANYDSDSSNLGSILNWGNYDKTNGYTSDGVDECNIIGEKTITWISAFFTILCIVGIILLIVMSIIEFIKAITGNNEDGIKDAFKHTMIRVVCLIALLLLPALITWVLNIVNENNYRVNPDTGKYVVGSDGNPLCKND